MIPKTAAATLEKVLDILGVTDGETVGFVVDETVFVDALSDIMGWGYVLFDIIAVVIEMRSRVKLKNIEGTVKGFYEPLDLRFVFFSMPIKYKTLRSMPRAIRDRTIFVLSLIASLPSKSVGHEGATHINVKITQFDSSHATKTYITE